MNSQNPRKIRVVAFCAPGPFQYYLLHLLQEQHDLVGVVFHENVSAELSLWQRLKPYFNVANAIQYIYARVFLPKYERQTERLILSYAPRFGLWQQRPKELNEVNVSDINSKQTLDFVRSLTPDVIAVNGTNLIREPLLAFGADLEYGMLNLHTGLSPYSRGGNCNLFMLIEGRPELVGGTVHYIDKGIDSGDIVVSYRPVLGENDPYEFIEAKVFIDGMHALSDVIGRSANVSDDEGVKRVKQWTNGKLFLKRTGYEYQLFDRVRANKIIQSGLIKNYLSNRPHYDQSVRLVGGSSSERDGV